MHDIGFVPINNQKQHNKYKLVLQYNFEIS